MKVLTEGKMVGGSGMVKQQTLDTKPIAPPPMKTTGINRGERIKKCPFCGGTAYFMVFNALSYNIRCLKCHSSGPVVWVPDYWSKGEKRLISRMFTRAVEPWNNRAIASSNQ